MKLDEKVEMYERLVRLSRHIVNECSRVISAFHTGGGEVLQGPDAEVKEMLELMTTRPEMWAHAEGAVRIALQEYAEARVLQEVAGQALKKYAEAKVLQGVLEGETLAGLELPGPGGAYLLGICDAIGELKRYFLEKMIAKEYEDARHVLEVAKTLFDYISGFNYPDAIIRSLRHKKDAARITLNSMLMVYAEKCA
ncbi:MAG TPA: hypothetical protein ENN60_01015 [archaeon]|nr:hypothetical protein [archaeon]